jgi:hypothetical protein
MVPTWAILPAAGKLLVQSIRHPNTGKAVVVDPGEHKVAVVSVKDAPDAGNGAFTSSNIAHVDR